MPENYYITCLSCQINVLFTSDWKYLNFFDLIYIYHLMLGDIHTEDWRFIIQKEVALRTVLFKHVFLNNKIKKGLKQYQHGNGIYPSDFINEIK